MARRKRLPRALGPWALDSGGFTELEKFGGWSIGPKEYAAEVRRFAAEVGNMVWAAPQDWMCEPIMLAKTGLSVAEHQQRTLNNYLDLRSIAPELPWVPVLQGWEVDDYFRHLEDYRHAGIDLASLPLVGVGTVCRRQGTKEAEELLAGLSVAGLRVHAFGFKFRGIFRSAHWLTSADSLAWSQNARRNLPMPGCTHKSCANCPRWALAWRQRLLEAIQRAERKVKQCRMY